MAKTNYTKKQLEKLSVEELRSLLGETNYTKKRLEKYFEKLSVEELRSINDVDSMGRENPLAKTITDKSFDWMIA